MLIETRQLWSISHCRILILDASKSLAIKLMSCNRITLENRIGEDIVRLGAMFLFLFLTTLSQLWYRRFTTGQIMYVVNTLKFSAFLFQIYHLHLQPQTSQSQLPEPLSGGAAEPDQSCLQEELHCHAEEKVTTSLHLQCHLICSPVRNQPPCILNDSCIFPSADSQPSVFTLYLKG